MLSSLPRRSVVPALALAWLLPACAEPPAAPTVTKIGVATFSHET